MTDKNNAKVAVERAKVAVERAKIAVQAINWGSDHRPHDMLRQLREALDGAVDLFSKEWDALRASRLSFELESIGKEDSPKYAASRVLHFAFVKVDDYLYEERLRSLE